MAKTYTVAEAAALIGVSDSSIRRKVDSGELDSYRFGERSIRIPASEVKAFIAKSHRGSVTRDGNGET